MAADQTICEGDSLNIGSVDTGNSFEWTSNPEGFASSLNNPKVAPAITTSYYLRETINATDSVTIIINPVPIARVADDQAFCESALTEISLGADAVTGNTYSWISIPSGFSSAESNPQVTPDVTTSYILTETVAGTICKSRDTVTITIHPDPDVSFVMEDNPIHREESTVLTARNMVIWYLQTESDILIMAARITTITIMPIVHG